MQCGLDIEANRLQHCEALRDAAAPISKNFDPVADRKRRILLTDRVHESVGPRGSAGGRDHNDPPAGVGVSHDIVRAPCNHFGDQQRWQTRKPASD